MLTSRMQVRCACTIVASLLLTVALSNARAAAPASSPFPIRGIKGLWWEGIEKYRLALPWIADHGMNFLMLCYSSFPASGKDWRADYTPEEMGQFRDLAQEADRRGVNICLSFNPGIWSNPPLVYSGDADYNRAWHKVRAIHALGIRWFGLCLDDINRGLQPADKDRYGDLQTAQIAFVNRLWADMKRLTPAPHLIFCPSAYTTEDARAHQDYIEAIGDGLDPDVMVFWTGPVVCSPTVTAEDARTFAAWVKRKPVLWDNYPVNDMFPWRPLLAPVKGRSSDLAPEISGYMANPMREWFASTIPLDTLSQYLRDPARYDAGRAIRRAVGSHPADEQPVLRQLVTLYGSSFLGERNYPPRPRPRSRADASKQLARYTALRDALSTCRGLEGLWKDVQPTLDADIRELERRSRDRAVTSPLQAEGDEFSGGAATLFGFRWLDRNTNYVYAQPTGRSRMSVDFFLRAAPTATARFVLTARDDETGHTLHIRISMNGVPLVDGVSPFPSDRWETIVFEVPAKALRVGRNRLDVRNLEKTGVQGMPPWFMVASAELQVK